MEIPTKVVRYFLGMTRSDDAPNSKFTAPQNDTERVVLHAVNQNPNDCRGQSYHN